ncbi:MAG: hypothetical protein NC039_05995 [Muribaculaceae bacterium]|nr:hypothetical protein [Muribaculaceae bacterium]
MPTRTIDTNGLHCLCASPAGVRRIAYILYPMAMLADWIEQASTRYATAIVVITGMDWDNDLTPWAASGVPKGSPDFKGDAPAFLGRLEGLVKDVETSIGTVNPDDRSLIGVSLSGLFTLWEWPQSTLFRNIASLSGSFWYEGFMEWFGRQDFQTKTGLAYFLLGDKESHSKVKTFDTVGANTLAIVSHLKSAGVHTEFESVPGNHYQFPIQRLDRAMTALTRFLDGQ